MTGGEFAWETTKAIGGFAGFASTAYVLWDRFWQRTPSAIVLAQPVMAGSKTLRPVLAIRNVADRPIIVSWRNGPDTGFRLAKDDSVRGIVQTMFPGAATAVVEPESTRRFHLLKPGNYDEINQENVIELQMSWKFAQPIIWQAPRKFRLSIRKADFEAILDEDRADTADS
ncbi:MAG: hypothetical protein ACTHM2_06435 [Afipia sp.]